MKTLTIGMATYNDFDGVYFTLQSLHANHPTEEVEYLVVDNAPQRCVRTEAVTRAVGGRYCHRPDLSGTSKPRDAVFRFAKTPWVMCIDCHVILETGAVESFLDFIRTHWDNPDKNIYSGPIVGDDGKWIATHWKRATEKGLWGVWDIMEGYKKIWNKGIGRPAFDNALHIQIDMMGLGLFAMRKDAWPGFNPLFRGFGGEEGYIHEVVRKNGGQAYCNPAVRWRHRFRDVGGWDKNPTPYPARIDDHTWNLLVGHRELGIECEAEIIQHFGKRLPTGMWDKMVEEVHRLQPFGEREKIKRQNLLAVWYTDNSAPGPLLESSLKSIQIAEGQTMRHNVDVVSSSWFPIPLNPFSAVVYSGEHKRSHETIAKQILEVVNSVDRKYDGLVFMEHDVLYPENYFDLVGDALEDNPQSDVISNQNYIGLNETGWLTVKQRDEPMHQLTIRFAFALINLDRALADCKKQGWAYLEPHHGEQRRNWTRLMPVLGDAGNLTMASVHVNHKNGRFTSHGEVVFNQVSTTQNHPHWGEAKKYWPGEMVQKVATGGCCGAPAPVFESMQKWYEEAKTKKSDFHEHVETIKSLSDHCDIVAEIGWWEKPALVAMAASSAKQIVSYSSKRKVSWELMSKLMGDRFKTVEGPVMSIERCDLLFLDTQHTGEVVYNQMIGCAAQVNKYIVVHTTEIYGETGDQTNTKGVLWGIRRFLMENKEWTVIRHDKNNFGLVVLSKLDVDRRNAPGKARQLLNFTKALAKHAKDGMRLVPDEVYNERIELCVMCPERAMDICGLCGCSIEKKASWASEKCPLDKVGQKSKWEVYKEVTVKAE